MEKNPHQNRLDPENQQYITQQLKLSKERLSENKIQEPENQKNIRNLLKLLTYKNDKIQKVRVQNKVETQGSKKLGLKTQLQIDKYIKDEMGAYQVPFSRKNTLTQFDSNRNDSSNTLELFQINERIKRTAEQSTLLEQLYAQREWERERKKADFDRVEKTEVNQLEYLLKQIRISKTNREKNGKHLEEQIESTMKGRKADEGIQKGSLSRKIDQFITKYFVFEASLKQLSQQLKPLVHPEKNLSKQKVFSLFLFQLVQNLEVVKKQSISMSSIALQFLIQNYQLTYTDSPMKLSSYVNIRCRKLTQSIQPIGTEYIFRQESLVFWCRLLMLFLSQKLTETELIQELNNEEHEYFIKSLKDFNKKKRTQNKHFLQSKLEYEKNVFYRIFVKIILCEPFSDSESTTLYEQQKEIITFLKLKHHPQFQRTMEFKYVKVNLMDQLRGGIDSKNVNFVSQILQKLIEIQAFDQIYFNFFSADPKRLSNLQLILLLNVIFQNPGLLEHCGKLSQKWVNHCFDMLRLLITDSGENSAQSSTRVLIIMLTLCKQYVSKKELQQKAIYLLSSNKLILKKFISPSIDYTSITTINWGLALSMLEDVLSKSINTQEQHEHFISELISPYIELNLKEIKAIPSTRKHMSNIQNAHKNKDLSKSRSNINRLIQFKDSLSLSQLVANNSAFICGFKLMIKLILKLLSEITQSYWADQMNIRIYKLKIIFSKTKKLCEVLTTHLNRQLSSRTNQSQLTSINNPASQNQLKRKECKLFINQISSLLDIFNILVIFIEIYKFSQNQDPIIIVNLSYHIQEFIWSEQGYTLKLNNFCQNLQKFKITDITFGFRFLSQITEKLLESLTALNFRQNRKINPLMREMNLSVIINFVGDSLKIIKSFAELEEKSSLTWKQDKYAHYAMTT